LRRIRVTLGDWVADCGGLAATWSHESGELVPAHQAGHSEPLEARYARFLAGHIKAIRRHQDSRKLYDLLVAYSREGWRLINRPADLCCGPCPTPTHDMEGGEGTVCGTMLYASEHADTVQCSRCRERYDVEDLRNALREYVKELMFTGSELRRLMETRLNDRMPKATFYKLIADGRLQPRQFRSETIKGKLIATPMFTYADVCVAREKPVPQRKAKRPKVDTPI
jgi:hypothetical protein